MTKRITVNIGNQSYTLVSEEEEDYVKRIATLVGSELEQVNTGSHLAMTDAAILAAVNIADKYFKEREAGDNLRRQLKEYLDEGSRLKNEISELKRENFRLQRQLDKGPAPT